MNRSTHRRFEGDGDAGDANLPYRNPTSSWSSAEDLTLFEKHPDPHLERVSSPVTPFSGLRRRIVTAIACLLSTTLFIAWSMPNVSGVPPSEQKPCDTVDEGYQCYREISHHWGQYAPFFSLDAVSEIQPDVPDDCKIIFVQVLSRHGARYPTVSKMKLYSDLIDRIQRTATSYMGDFVFLKDYKYSMGADNLTIFGENEMAQSGFKFYTRYAPLTRTIIPFARSSGSGRVTRSAELFLHGFQNAKTKDPYSNKNDSMPTIRVIIEESDSSNNTLSHGGCPAFEGNRVADSVQRGFLERFAPAIVDRFEASLPGVNLSVMDVRNLMDLCAFETVAKTPDAAELSRFCCLFTEEEWRHYDYYQSLGKYYAFGAGNPLGAAQGIGFVNELIARMTNTPVHDGTNVNHTLDSDPALFPLNAMIYADFTHDNSMTSIYTALGLYNGTKRLSKSRMESTTETNGYSAAWTVPFGARSYIEMMQCRSENEPLVRVLVNDRIVPLHGCKVDYLGRCKRGDYVEGLSFARTGGNWASCFPTD